MLELVMLVIMIAIATTIWVVDFIEWRRRARIRSRSRAIKAVVDLRSIGEAPVWERRDEGWLAIRLRAGR